MRTLRSWLPTLVLITACGGGPNLPDASSGDAGARDAEALPVDGGADAGSTRDAGTPDADANDAGANDAGDPTDAGSADGGASDDAGSPGDDAGPESCDATVSELGIATEQGSPPAVAHHPSGATLFAWTDFDGDHVYGALRRGDGTVSDLGDLGLYTFAGPDPNTWPAVVARDGGFTVAWVEQYRDAGGFTRERFRVVSLGTDGARGADTTITQGYALHYTDVRPRLFDVGGRDVLVYRGRIAGPPLETHLVFRALDGGFAAWTVPEGRPEQVAWNGTHFGVATRIVDEITIRRFDPDGGAVLPETTTGFRVGAGTPLRIAATAAGWTLLDRDHAIQITPGGAPIGGAISVGAGLAVASGDSESLILGLVDGRVTAWRLSAAGAETLELPFHTYRTIVAAHPEALAWTGTQWVGGFTDDVIGLDDQARAFVLCDP